MRAKRIREDSNGKYAKTFRDVFRIRLSKDPSARVDPMHIELNGNHLAFRSTQRRYAPPQREFIIETTKSLEEVNAVYSNPNTKWASSALAVNKTSKEKFRFPVDFRGPNRETIPIVKTSCSLWQIAKYFAR